MKISPPLDTAWMPRQILPKMAVSVPRQNLRCMNQIASKLHSKIAEYHKTFEVYICRHPRISAPCNFSTAFFYRINLAPKSKAYRLFLIFCKTKNPSRTTEKNVIWPLSNQYPWSSMPTLKFLVTTNPWNENTTDIFEIKRDSLLGQKPSPKP